jgi:hypothetical protein
VIFERTRGSELGRIENVIGEDANGNLTLTFAFSLKKDGVPEGSEAEKAHFAPMEGAYLGAVASTLAAVRRTVDEKGREHLAPKHPTDAAGDTVDLRLLPRRRRDGYGADARAAHRRHDADICQPSDRARQGRLQGRDRPSVGQHKGLVAQHDRGLVDPRRTGRHRRGDRAIHPARRQRSSRSSSARCCAAAATRLPICASTATRAPL